MTEFPVVMATARSAGQKVVHTVTATRNGEPVTVHRATRRSAHRYAHAIIHWVTGADGNRAVVVDRWTNTPQARADQARIPVRWEPTGDWGDVAVGDYVSSWGHHGAGQPEVYGRVVTSRDGTVWIQTPDGATRQRSISHVRRV